MKKPKILALLIAPFVLALGLVLAGCKKDAPVIMSGWGGDPKVNAWISGELLPYAAKTGGIEARWSPMNIDEILAKLEN